MKKNKKDCDVIQSSGGLIWRDSPGGKELAIIYRKRYNDWTLPKGKLESGECWRDAAIREVWEEAGCKVEIESFAGCISYTHRETPKIVLYWNMKLIGDCQFQPTDEVDQLQWLKAEEALLILNYLSEKELVQKNLK